MTPAHPLWLDIAFALVAIAPIAWMGRQWLKEWRAHRAGTMLPRGYRPPEPPTLRQPWRWRFLWLYAAQVVVIGWLTYGMASAQGWGTGAFYLAMNTIIVAFATAILTRLWDRTAALVRRRGSTSERQQPPGEQIRVLRSGRGFHERP